MAPSVSVSVTGFDCFKIGPFHASYIDSKEVYIEKSVLQEQSFWLVIKIMFSWPTPSLFLKLPSARFRLGSAVVDAKNPLSDKANVRLYYSKRINWSNAITRLSAALV